MKIVKNFFLIFFLNVCDFNKHIEIIKKRQRLEKLQRVKLPVISIYRWDDDLIFREKC